ncbi:MAG: SprT family zinc-dependent metalloprotease [Lachnospiraceae bacterium]|nr:SprT family zinc-dependent metalloprotease [Lachnospiraceae bacterium]
MTGEEEIEYRIIKSGRRKTMGIVITGDGSVEVRIPVWVTYAAAEEFVKDRYDWILKSRKKMLARKEKHDARNWDEIRQYTTAWIAGTGGLVFRAKVAYWAQKLGVTYNRITIRDVSSRWGSCSARGNLSFSWKIFVMPERLVDYLVVHELSHLRYMNHSREFWDMVQTYIPDYKKIKKEFEEYV